MVRELCYICTCKNNEVIEMEEIKIYRSLQKNALLLLVCAVFTCGGVYLLISGAQAFLAWGNIVLFGGLGLYLLYLLVRERLGDHPYLVISEDGIAVDGQRVWAVSFADVEAFHLVGVSKSMQIAVKYKPDVRVKKLEATHAIGKAFRRMNEELIGAQESFPVDNLEMKPQTILDLLNKRLESVQRQSI